METAAPAKVIDRGFVAAWASRFIDAWNAGDAGGVASLCAEDVVWSDPSIPAPVTGREAVHEFVAAMWGSFPDLCITETAPPLIAPGGGRVLSPYRMTGTMLGEMQDFAPTGRNVSLEGVDDWTFQGGLLSRYCTYYDTIDAARQLGILPPAGSRSGRAMVRAQRLQAAFQRAARRARR